MSSFSENFFKTSQKLMSYSLKRNTLPEILQKKGKVSYFPRKRLSTKGLRRMTLFSKVS